MPPPKQCTESTSPEQPEKWDGGDVLHHSLVPRVALTSPSVKICPSAGSSRCKTDSDTVWVRRSLLVLVLGQAGEHRARV